MVMAGYAGYSMSNNAVAAYEEGMKPISKIKKADLPDGMTVKFFKFLVSKGLITASEWHHTSKHYNRTEFFDPTEIAYQAREIENQLKRQDHPVGNAWQALVAEFEGHYIPYAVVKLDGVIVAEGSVRNGICFNVNDFHNEVKITEAHEVHEIK